jgi:hypothetical protein
VIEEDESEELWLSPNVSTFTPSQSAFSSHAEAAEDASSAESDPDSDEDQGHHKAMSTYCLSSPAGTSANELLAPPSQSLPSVSATLGALDLFGAVMGIADGSDSESEGGAGEKGQEHSGDDSDDEKSLPDRSKRTLETARRDEQQEDGDGDGDGDEEEKEEEDAEYIPPPPPDAPPPGAPQQAASFLVRL